MVKSLFLIFVFTLLNIFSVYPENNLTLNEIMKNYQYKFVRDSPFGGIKEFPELQIKLLTYSEDIKSPSLLGAFYNNSLVGIYGVMYGDQANYYYMYDFNGDGVYEYNGGTQYIIPPWVTYKINIPRNNLNNFLDICSELYLMYNSNEGINNQRLIEILNNVIRISNTVTEFNRDTYYSFLQYFLFYDRHPEISLNIMLALCDHIIYIIDDMVPLLIIYTGETYLKTGNNEKALNYFNILRNMDNNCKVAEYYIAKLNDQKNNTNKNMEVFKNKYPGFWMINKN